MSKWFKIKIWLIWKKPGWGVPVLKAWKDKTAPDVVAHLRTLAEKEREMRRFGGE